MRPFQLSKPYGAGWLGLLILSLVILLCGSAFAQRGAGGVVSGPGSAAKQRRVALVIGNSGYASKPLLNAGHDAADLARALEGLGFEVTLKHDLSQSKLKYAIDRFGKRLKKSGVGLFFYAGHGIQVDGENYLIPLGANISEPELVEYEAVNAERVLAWMRSAKNALNIMILDACRSNPFPAVFRDGGAGLAAVKQMPRGSIVLFSAAPGEKAADGQGRNSPFTRALLATLRQPGLTAMQALQSVQTTVYRSTGGKQSPWLQNSPLMGRFYFQPGKVADVTPPPPPPPDPKPAASAPPPSSGVADLHVTTEPKEAVVYLDGQRKGRSPQTFQMIPAGKHKLAARKGYLVAKQDISLARDDLKRVHLKLEHEKGDLRLFSQPSGAMLSLDGKQYSPTPVRIKGLKAGTHKVVLSKSQGNDYYAYKGDLLIKPGSNRQTLQLTKSQIPGRIKNGLGQEYVLIQPGSFMMGSPSNEPKRDGDETQHRVTISRSFYMQTTEVTQGQWRAVMGNNPSYFKGDDLPVEQVSWDDVQGFIRKLNAREGGNKYRLPTESEWEYACRAGTTTPFHTGNNITTDQANYNGNYPMPGYGKGEYRQKALAVKSFRPNAWGLYDMHGNVWEWVQDWYGNYPSGSVTDPKGPGSGTQHMLRGGSWLNNAWLLRSASRGWLNPVNRDFYVGFRLAKDK